MSNRRRSRQRNLPPRAAGLTPAVRSFRAAIRESAATVERVRETFTGAIAAAPQPTDGALILDVQVIEAGWNSSYSRYYPKEMLARDVGGRIFGPGTFMFINHPTATEETERPERDLRDLAAIFTEAPYTTDGGQTMRVKARVYGPYRELITEAWRDIGVSINAAGLGELGEREGRTGLIINELTEGYSVDFVTRPGAGGRIVSLLESARRATRVEEAAAIRETSADQMRTALDAAIRTTYGDDEHYCWVRDYDPDRGLVWFEVGDSQGSACWQQPYTASGEGPAVTVELDGDRTQVVAQTVYTPVPAAQADTPDGEDAAEVAESHTPEISQPATGGAETVTDGAPPTGSPNPPSEEEPAMSGTQTGPAPGTAGTATVVEPPTAPSNSGISNEARAEIAEARLAEANARIAALEAQTVNLTGERDQARSELRQTRHAEAARTACGSALDATDLPAPARQRVVESVSGRVPTTDAGDVDTSALSARITAAVEAEKAYIAAVREAAGAGVPTGLGGTTPLVESADDAAAFHTDLAARFTRLGLDANSAALAARR